MFNGEKRAKRFEWHRGTINRPEKTERMIVERTIKWGTKGKKYFSINHVLHWTYIDCTISINDPLQEVKNFQKIGKFRKINNIIPCNIHVVTRIYKTLDAVDKVKKKKGGGGLKRRKTASASCFTKNASSLCRGRGKGNLSKTFPSAVLHKRRSSKIPKPLPKWCPFFDQPSFEQSGNRAPPPLPPTITFRAN